MKAKIELPWMSSLLDNQAYVAGDTKLGHTGDCRTAMWQIVMLLRPAVGYGWEWNGERIQVRITAFRPRKNIDAQNLIKAISDAIEDAIHVDDKYYDISTKAVDKYEGKPRIEIELSQ